MFRLPAVMLLVVLLPQRCDFSGDVARKAEREIKPYFPEAQASLAERGRTLRTITCVNLGVKAIESLPPTLDEKTKELRSGFVRAFAGINTFELGFEQSILRLDLASGRYSIVPAAIPAGYSAQYNTTCKRAIQVPSEAQIYIGRFKVSVRTPNNQTQVVETIDTLGIYRPEEFNAVREAEIEARRWIMSSELQKRGLNVIGIELVSVGRISAPDTRGWELEPTAEVEFRLPNN